MVNKKNDWPRVAAALAADIPRDTLHPAVLAWVEESAPRGRWAVAFSGGADSLALLLLLWAHWPERRDRLVALHFNHRLRGRAALADARFCAKVCAALGVAFAEGAWRDAFKGAGEAEARDARFAFFRAEQKRRRAPALWLGHQLDDVAETMLMRLARGSGSAGLAAPRPVQTMPGGRVHLRPLLAIAKADLVALIGAAGAVWREDATNGRPDFFRNRIRRDVLPAWRTAAAPRDVLAATALSRSLLEEDDVALELWVDELGCLSADGRLDVKKLSGRPRAVVRRALRRWLAAVPHGSDLSRHGFEALLEVVEWGRSTRFSLGTEGFAVLRRGTLSFERVSSRGTR